LVSFVFYFSLYKSQSLLPLWVFHLFECMTCVIFFSNFSSLNFVYSEQTYEHKLKHLNNE
jgi:predicted Na+-dependent transporter